MTCIFSENHYGMVTFISKAYFLCRLALIFVASFKIQLLNCVTDGWLLEHFILSVETITVKVSR